MWARPTIYQNVMSGIDVKTGRPIINEDSTPQSVDKPSFACPYLVGGNCTALAPGHAFSVEPGIYLAGRYGARIEDIVVATDAGPDALNAVDHGLALVDA